MNLKDKRIIVEDIFTEQTNNKYDMRYLLGLIRALEKRVELAEKCMVTGDFEVYSEQYPDKLEKTGF